MAETSRPLATATFAGGCFWCMEGAFAGTPGIIAIVSGYTGGQTPDPSYDDVCSGETGHTEAVQITFDPAVTSYSDLLDVFWRNIDPTDAGGQFVDRGTQYRTGIFSHTEDQNAEALASRAALDASGRFTRPLAVAVEPAGPFYPAEDYHQRYFRKNPLRYQAYHHGSSRSAALAKLWGDTADKP